MTNFWEELDKVTFQLRNSYLYAYDNPKLSFIIAARKLFVRNMAAPPSARVLDMEEFKPPGISYNSHSRERQSHYDKVEKEAQEYCDYWEPRIEAKMSEFREQNMSEMNQV